MTLRRHTLFMQGAAGFSASAQLAINRLTAPPVAFQNAMAVFIDANVLNGNWPDADNPGSGLIDEFYYSGGAGVTLANSLTGWIAKTATNHGATKINDGWSLNNATTDWIDTNFNPNVDGSQLSLNDMLVGGYVKTDNNPGGVSRVLCGSVGGGGRTILYRAGSDKIIIELNQNAAGVNTAEPVFGNDSLHIAVREASNIIRYYKDGALNASDNDLSTSLTNADLEIGSLVNGTFGNFNGTISMKVVGAAIGFDHAGFDTSLSTLLTSMGV